MYATFTGPLGPLHPILAALLWGGSAAQATGLTALAVYGCIYLPADPRVHLLIPATTRRRAPRWIVQHRTTSMPRARHRHDLRLSPPDRAAIVAAGQLDSLRDVRALLGEVVQRQLTTTAHLEAALKSSGRRHSALTRQAMDDIGAGCRSAPEMELRDLLRRRPQLLLTARFNHDVVLGSGRRFVADVCWPDARIIVEVDSVEHHGLGDGPETTARRRAALTAAGWVVLSISPGRIRTEPDLVLAEIEAVHERGNAALREGSAALGEG